MVEAKPNSAKTPADWLAEFGDQRTSDGRYLVRDVMRLAYDAEFQKRFGADPELIRLFALPSVQADRDAEDAQMLGMCERVAGVDVPPVTLGHIRVLQVVGNELVSDQPDWNRGFEFQLQQLVEALFILANGPRAVGAFCDLFRWRRAVAEWRDKVGGNPALLDPLLAAEQRAAEGLRVWDAAVLTWGAAHVRLGDGETVVDALQRLEAWVLSAFRGFKLFPQTMQAEKKTPSSGMRRARLCCARAFVRCARRLLPRM
jgi:hypothetical protein